MLSIFGTKKLQNLKLSSELLILTDWSSGTIEQQNNNIMPYVYFVKVNSYNIWDF